MKKPIRYKLTIPKNYKRKPLPGRDIWCRDLESGKHRQGTGKLYDVKTRRYCCLGRKSRLDGCLVVNDGEGWDMDDNNGILSTLNPDTKYLYGDGRFPTGVKVHIRYGGGWMDWNTLAECNDEGLTFKQIARIIRKVWYDLKPNKAHK